MFKEFIKNYREHRQIRKLINRLEDKLLLKTVDAVKEVEHENPGQYVTAAGVDYIRARIAA